MKVATIVGYVGGECTGEFGEQVSAEAAPLPRVERRDDLGKLALLGR